jgi:hypothetical protein
MVFERERERGVNLLHFDLKGSTARTFDVELRFVTYDSFCTEVFNCIL